MEQVKLQMVILPLLLDHQVWVAQALVVTVVLKQMPQARVTMETEVTAPAEQ
jgi:hypothetical protein